jgi:KDO2-lipid IV(A) lauroyltransferase
LTAVADVIVFKAIYLVMRLIGALPRPLIFVAANVLGDLWFAFDGRHRTVAMDNLKRAFKKELSEEERRAVARENFRQLARLVFELGWSLHLKRQDIGKHVRIEGFHHVHRAFRRNKGVLFLTAHMGSWELLTLVPALIPYKVHDIYRPLDYPPLERFFVDFRTRFGLGLIAKEGAIMKMMKALSRNEGVAIPLDQSVGVHDGVFADFFGESTCTSKGFGLIAMKKKPEVLSVFMVRENKGYKVIFGPRIPLSDSGDAQIDLLENTNRFNRAIEGAVRSYPSQWFWVHNRWKTKKPEDQ